MAIPNCNLHEKSCVLYCKECCVFLCVGCVDSDTHMKHEFCSVERGFAVIREERADLLHIMRKIRNKTAKSTATGGYAEGIGDNMESTLEEKDLLSVFRVLESEIADLKTQCMFKLWEQKQPRNSDAQSKRMQLSKMDRAIHALQMGLKDPDCSPADLIKQRDDASDFLQDFQLDELIRGHPAHYDTAAEKSQVFQRDQLAREFLNSVRKLLSPARLYSWLSESERRGLH